MKKLNESITNKIDLRCAKAVEEARRDLHVQELYNKASDLLNNMESYLDTIENIQLWRKLYAEAHTAYENAAREAQYVGMRLRTEILCKEYNFDYWNDLYLQ